MKYSEDSPSGLRRLSGKVAGTKVPKGYYRVNVGSRKFEAHRVIWELHYGPIGEGLFIDHKDGNPSNNLIGNLRTVTRAVNQRNMKRSKANSSGVTGVQMTTNSKGNQYWRASCYRLDGTKETKTFSVLRFGDEVAKCLAIEARAEMLAERKSAGAGYSDRHGTQNLQSSAT